MYCPCAIIMLISDDKKHVLDLINGAERILIIPSPKKGVDSLSAAIALGLIAKQLNKEISLVYQGDTPEFFIKYKDIINIKDSLEAKSLIIAINYKDTPVEKINYSVENEVLNLVVTPVPSNFDLNRVSYSKTGTRIDLAIIVGSSSLNDLGAIYSQNYEEFRKMPTLNINNSDEGSQFGTINVIEPEFESLTEMLFNKLALWGFKLNKDIAEVLLLGFRSINAGNVQNDQNSQADQNLSTEPNPEFTT